MRPFVETVPRLSWSQVSTYTQCPAKWCFSRHFPPERTPSSLKFGGAIHRAVETFYRAQMKGHRAGMDEVFASFLDSWEATESVPVLYGKEETADSLKVMAERMLLAFLDGVQPGKIIAIEQPFAVEPVEGILVSGIVDLVEVKEEKFWVVDNKTAKNSPSDSFDREQVGLYRLGLEEVGIIPQGMQVGLRYDILRKLKTRSEFVSVEVETTEKELADLRKKLGTIWKAMESGIVFRTRSWACDSCQWSKACAEVDLSQLVRGNGSHSSAE